MVNIDRIPVRMPQPLIHNRLGNSDMFSELDPKVFLMAVLTTLWIFGLLYIMSKYNNRSRNIGIIGYLLVTCLVIYFFG